MCDIITVSGSAQLEPASAPEPDQPVYRGVEAGWLRFDPQKRAGSPRLKAAVKALIADLEAHEAKLGLRQRRRDRAALTSFHLAAEAIGVNLLWSTMDPLSRPLAVLRDTSALRGKSRYKPACYGLAFTGVLDLMARPEVALIENLTRGYSYRGGGAAPSTVRPTADFLDRYAPPGLTWRDFQREPEAEVLVLKARKEAGATTSERAEYADTGHTRKLRREVQRINRILQDAPFWFEDDAGSLGLTKGGQMVDPLRRTVWRGFNNSSWKEGGRLWGGAWENMRRADRFRLLRIGSARHPEGEPVCNVDLRSLNPVLCYVLAGLPVPDRDLYDIRGDGTCRAAFKVLLSAMLFASGRFTHMPREAQEEFPPGTKTRDVVAAVERYHAPIAHHFWCGYGYRLTFVESSILLAALDDLNRQGVTALPLHDSVLVARSEAQRAKLALETAFASCTNHFGVSINIDYGEQYQ